MTIEEKIELVFFDPSRTRDEYIEFYKSLNPERVKKERGKYRYSPLFLCLKDIRYCYAVGKEFNSVRKIIHPSEFAGIILIRICFKNTIDRLYFGNLNKFAATYMGITDHKHLEVLNLLRNSLEHSYYSLYTYRENPDKTKTKIYFSLGHYNFLIKKQEDWKRPYKSEMYMINPRELFLRLQTGLNKFKNDLLDSKNTKLRENIMKSFSLDKWVATGP
jgi:hypothetical protein